MLARTYRSIAPYDAAVTQLRDYFDRLLRDGTEWSTPRPAPTNPNGYPHETQIRPTSVTTARRASGPASVPSPERFLRCDLTLPL